MSAEQFTESELDYSSQEVVSGILAEGDPSKLQALAEKFNMEISEIELISEFAKLRRETHLNNQRALDARVEGEFNPSEEERNLGAYKEVLEPQVREVVLALRKKGYSTIESGFVDIEAAQNIRSLEPVFKDVTFKDELIAEFASKGVTITLTPYEIKLNFNKFVPLDEIKDMWQIIAGTLPDLGRPALAKTPHTQGLSGLNGHFAE